MRVNTISQSIARLPKLTLPKFSGTGPSGIPYVLLCTAITLLLESTSLITSEPSYRMKQPKVLLGFH